VPPGAYPPHRPFGPLSLRAGQTGNGYAVTALVLGLVSLFLSWFPGVDWVLGALAIIFGAVGISTARRRGGAGRGWRSQVWCSEWSPPCSDHLLGP